jgi:UDP:flavonoid glycosyltransferase YjiC (YdhE family)
MPDFLFATWDGGGNVPPAVVLATELRRRGHTVRFLGHETQREALTGAGFAFAPYDGVRPFSGVEAASVPRLLALFSDRALGGAVLAELEERPADVVVVDCLLVPVLRACADAGQTFVSLEHLLDAYLRGGWLHGPVGLVDRLKQMNPVSAWNQAALCLVAAPPSLDPAAGKRLPGNVRHVGPLIDPPRPHDLAAHDPAVLVSLSTFHYAGMTSALQRILDATADLGVRVIVTTGPVIDPNDLRPAANHEVHRFVPHDEVMPQVSLVVGHGGHATTMRALAHDLPLALMPMHPLLDQPLVAKAVAGQGAGEVLRKKASPEQIRPVVERLLGDGPHRAAAARLGAEIRALDGTRTAADLVEGLIQRSDGPGGGAELSPEG